MGSKLLSGFPGRFRASVRVSMQPNPGSLLYDHLTVTPSEQEVLPGCMHPASL